MSIREAARLVIKGAFLDQNKTYILDMGKPIKIIDLAKTLIKLSGDNSIKIINTGLTKGEKINEKLFDSNETRKKTIFNKLYEINTSCDNIYKTSNELNEFISKIKKIADSGNNKKIKSAISNS